MFISHIRRQDAQCTVFTNWKGKLASSIGVGAGLEKGREGVGDGLHPSIHSAHIRGESGVHGHAMNRPSAVSLVMC
jgi:hypothetical protein